MGPLFCYLLELSVIGLFAIPVRSIKNNDDRNCNFTEFQCSSGKCIDDSVICDGTPDCDDSSDETEALCGSITCPQHVFRCRYGACVSVRSLCNGIMDCVDGSDEICTGNSSSISMPSANVNPLRPSFSRGCTIPVNPAHGNYTTSDGKILIVNCNSGYTSDPLETFYSTCQGGVWKPDPPVCARSCPPIKQEKLDCDYYGNILQSCNYAIDEVRATGACLENMESNDHDLSICVYRCLSGHWNLISVGVLE